MSSTNFWKKDSFKMSLSEIFASSDAIFDTKKRYSFSILLFFTKAHTF